MFKYNNDLDFQRQGPGMNHNTATDSSGPSSYSEFNNLEEEDGISMSSDEEGRGEGRGKRSLHTIDTSPNEFQESIGALQNCLSPTSRWVEIAFYIIFPFHEPN